jgi:hypothetical protein
MSAAPPAPQVSARPAPLVAVAAPHSPPREGKVSVAPQSPAKEGGNADPIVTADAQALSLLSLKKVLKPKVPMRFYRSDDGQDMVQISKTEKHLQLVRELHIAENHPLIHWSAPAPPVKEIID